VQLINTQGMAFIGPGSEWFWTAISGLVLAITFFAIYRQLRLQRSEGAIAQIDSFVREWNSERLLICRREVLLALRDAPDATALPPGAAGRLGNYWEGIAGLTHAGHLDRRLLYTQYGNACQLSWALLAPHTRALREHDHDPTLYADFEWLVGVLDGFDRRAGAESPLASADWRERSIVSLDGLIAVERSLRAVYIDDAADRDARRSPRPRIGHHQP
jgi:hypothetical protein